MRRQRFRTLTYPLSLFCSKKLLASGLNLIQKFEMVRAQTEISINLRSFMVNVRLIFLALLWLHIVIDQFEIT